MNYVYYISMKDEYFETIFFDRKKFIHFWKILLFSIPVLKIGLTLSTIFLAIDRCLISYIITVLVFIHVLVSNCYYFKINIWWKTYGKIQQKKGFWGNVLKDLWNLWNLTFVDQPEVWYTVADVQEFRFSSSIRNVSCCKHLRNIEYQWFKFGYCKYKLRNTALCFR